ncbi:hypothetical protein CSKR_107645 [Clonorchis sinensis]|uniref:Uncharacterized protein n=1 Tax=Clonorchis sinensis TaxID=79923 RepID=A0A419PTM5_CLOSI|nr:hypothetical protein CSKR_107645 [Clonorchis sinensis]
MPLILSRQSQLRLPLRDPRDLLTLATGPCLAAMPPVGSTRAGILPGFPSLDRGSREAEIGFEPRTFRSFSRETQLSIPFVIFFNRKCCTKAAACFRWYDIRDIAA